MPASSPSVVIVSGPSGSGKSTLVERLSVVPGTIFSISCTTRPPRVTESPGKCYDFITEAEFQRRVDNHEFLEYAQVFGKHWYGTPRKWVDQARAKKQNLILEIDVQGAAQVKKQIPEALAVFIIPPSRQTVEQRLRARGQDSEEAIRGRLDRARQEISCWTEYDFVVVNDDLDRASDDLRSILLASRCSRKESDERIQQILETFGGS